MIQGVLLPNPLTAGPCRNSAADRAVGEKKTNGFSGLLDARLGDSRVRFSGHALERLRERGINLGEAELRKLEGAVSSVAAKGGNESLIMVGNAALVVSVKNRTVITAFDRQNLDGNVFTNIDSAAIF